MSALIGINIGTPVGPHLDCIAGIRAYLKRYDLDWELRLCRGHVEDFAGVAGLIVDRRLPPLPLALLDGLPVASVFGGAPGLPACATLEPRAFGELAARHFQERGYRQGCVIDSPRLPDTLRQRQSAFLDACRAQGLQRVVLHHDDRDRLAELLANLAATSVPLGIYLGSDHSAAWWRQMMLDAGIRLPGKLALLGTGNHPYTCLRVEPGLSTISYPWRSLGEAAARRLHFLLQGLEPPPPPCLVPFQVVDRDSTPTVAMPVGPLVRRAQRWLRQHLDDPTPLRSLTAAMACPQATLCRYFRQQLGTSPKQYHDRLRLERAAQLLEETTLSIDQIATRVGFRSRTALGVAFSRRYGCSPTDWRRERSAVNVNL